MQKKKINISHHYPHAIPTPPPTVPHFTSLHFCFKFPPPPYPEKRKTSLNSRYRFCRQPSQIDFLKILDSENAIFTRGIYEGGGGVCKMGRF